MENYLEEQVEELSSLVEEIDELLDVVGIEIDESIDTTQEYIAVLADVIYENREEFDKQVLEALVDAWYTLLESETEYELIEQGVDLNSVDWSLFESDDSDEAKQKRLHQLVLAHEKYLDQLPPEEVKRKALVTKRRKRLFAKREKERAEIEALPKAELIAKARMRHARKLAKKMGMAKKKKPVERWPTVQKMVSSDPKYGKTPPWKLTRLSAAQKRRRSMKRVAKMDTAREQDYLSHKKPGGMSWMHLGGHLGPREKRPAHAPVPHHLPVHKPIPPAPSHAEIAAQYRKMYPDKPRPEAPPVSKKGPEVKYVKKLVKSS